MSVAPRTLMVFVDGVGLGETDPRINPICRGCCPHFERLLADHAVPIDASLHVKGLPQSATGQATLFTGENAAKHAGRHVEGCPGPTIRALVREHNVFDKLTRRGYRSTFANAYYVDDPAEVEGRRRQSVSTVSALKAFGAVRDTAALRDNRAVYQDLTRDALRQRGYTGPIISPEEAGEHLVELAWEYDFTLFEYFQTDLMAHRGTAADMERVLSDLDRFLKVVVDRWRHDDRLLVLTSDHGNVEDGRIRSHTANPVPLVAIGEGCEVLLERVRGLEDFTPALLHLYPAKAC